MLMLRTISGWGMWGSPTLIWNSWLKEYIIPAKVNVFFLDENEHYFQVMSIFFS